MNNMGYIFAIFWIIYCSLEGIYDSWVYFGMPESIKYVKILPFKFHIPHAIAFIQRMFVGISISLAINEMIIDIDFLKILFCLALMLPLIQTGFYLSFRTFLSKKMNVSAPRDARGKKYNFFSYTHKNSSIFPDYSPWFRLAMFLLGICLFIIQQNGYI